MEDTGHEEACGTTLAHVTAPIPNCAAFRIGSMPARGRVGAEEVSSGEEDGLGLSAWGPAVLR